MTSPTVAPGAVALVAAGGAAGTLCRWGVSHLLPAGDLPWPTLAVNLAGAFTLGFLLEAVSRGGPESSWTRPLRLLLGTGFLGGFTTFSALALDLARLAGAGSWAAGWTYAGLSLVGGVLAAWLGVLAGARRRSRGMQRRRDGSAT